MVDSQTPSADGLKAEGSTLKVHHLRPAPGARTPTTRVGRGGGSKGKTAGRGTKGTSARRQVPEAFEGGQMPLHMRVPKLRGFKNPFRTVYQVVNLDRLNALYPDGGVGYYTPPPVVRVLNLGPVQVTAVFQSPVDCSFQLCVCPARGRR